MGTVADFYRALAKGEAWTPKDDMQDVIIQQLLQRVEKLEQELASRSVQVSRAEIIDVLIAAFQQLKQDERR